MFNNVDFQITSVEKSILVSSEKHITDTLFKVYIPRLMPKIALSPPTEKEEDTGKDLIINEDKDSFIEEEIETQNYLQVRSMTDYRSWLFGQIYKMSMSASQTDTEVEPDPEAPQKDASQFDTREYPEDWKPPEDPHDFEGVDRPYEDYVEIPKIMVTGHDGPPHPNHTHPISEPFQFFNVLFEELNDVEVYFGQEMIGCFISGDLNDYRVIHIPGAIPQKDGRLVKDPYEEEDFGDIQIDEIDIEELDWDDDVEIDEMSVTEMEEATGELEEVEYEEHEIETTEPPGPDHEAEPQSPEDAAEEVEEEPDEDEEEPPEDIDDIELIALDAGHGGHDPGAVNDSLGIHEADIVLDIILNHLQPMLEGMGYDTLLTRSAYSEFLYPSPRGQLAMAEGADMFISVHLNGATPSAHGSEVLYRGGESDSQYLADLIQANFVSYLNLRDRGNKARNDLGVLNNTGPIPSVLVEPLFISNPEEGESVMSDGTQELIAQAIADAVEQFDS